MSIATSEKSMRTASTPDISVRSCSYGIESVIRYPLSSSDRSCSYGVEPVPVIQYLLSLEESVTVHTVLIVRSCSYGIEPVPVTRYSDHLSAAPENVSRQFIVGISRFVLHMHQPVSHRPVVQLPRFVQYMHQPFSNRPVVQL